VVRCVRQQDCCPIAAVLLPGAPIRLLRRALVVADQARPRVTTLMLRQTKHQRYQKALAVISMA
jgi:hypothetical protein